MEAIMAVKSKHLAVNNLITSLYLPAMYYMFDGTNKLYRVGKYENLGLILFLAVVEVVKCALFYMKQTKTIKSSDLKHLKPQNLLKTCFSLLTMIGLFYGTAVLFGAPVFTSQEETLMFSLLLTALTVLPLCLYFGHDAVVMLFSSLISFDGSDFHMKFLLNIRLTLFGAWLGAVIIPLDWEKPYQEWPIPCCLGAVGGYWVSNLVCLALYSLQPLKQKTGKFSL